MCLDSFKIDSKLTEDNTVKSDPNKMLRKSIMIQMSNVVNRII